MRISDWSSDVCSSDLSLPFANINEDALVQVMINLLKNAAEALEHSRKPRIRVETAFRHGVSVVVGKGKGDRKSVVWGKSVSVRVDLGGRLIINKKTI